MKDVINTDHTGIILSVIVLPSTDELTNSSKEAIRKVIPAKYRYIFLIHP